MIGDIMSWPNSAPRRGRPYKSEQERERQREKLLDTAVVVIRDKGPGVSMNDIAAAAGVSKPVVYDLCGSKADFSMALSVHVFQKPLATIIASTGSLAERLRTAVDAFAEVVERDTAVYRFLVVGARPGSRSLVDQPLFTMLAPVAKAVVGLDGPLADVSVVGVLAMIFGALEQWSLEHDRAPRGVFAEQVTAMALAALDAAS
ncbi:TetR/AcrR family transcriptional regulator [Nocardia vaccinii]|uniref:TetR/AcrR family transcriptional regulator n=1 Tax=Nocardia vaccinii TaxID=1822 RepID=UPI0008366A26|nr:TetR/AcrR family transcriptional regulator [Nocardia vaccinii]